MYKLLIVEDEKWEREGLIDYLNWEELDIEIVGAAANGVQGIKLAKEHSPDIIISDIKMPMMDGIEMAKQVGQLIPDCKVIFITGYDDFKYAKEAIRLGAYEYLLKPVQRHQLLDAISFTIQKIDERRSQMGYISKLKRHLSQSVYEERERFLINLLEVEDKSQVDFSNIGFSDFNKGAYGFSTVILRFDFVFSLQLKEYCEKRTYQKELFQIICSAVGNQGIVARNNNVTNEIIICLLSNVNDREYIQGRIEQVRMKCREASMSEAVIGVGCFFTTPNGFAQSFMQAKSALEQIFFRNQEILFYQDIYKKADECGTETYNLYSYAVEYSKKVLNGIVSVDTNGVLVATDELFEMMEQQPGDKGTVCNLIAGMASEVCTLLFSYDISFSDRLINEDIVGTLYEFIKLEHMKVWFKELLEHASRCIYDKKSNKEEKIVTKVMDIIRTEYNTSIGIETIAYRLELSPNYLGTLLKRYTGKGFTETLTDIRMSRAEELLIYGEEALSYIAENTGYINTSHFCKVFKKRYGVSPIDFRKRHHNI